MEKNTPRKLSMIRAEQVAQEERLHEHGVRYRLKNYFAQKSGLNPDNYVKLVPLHPFVQCKINESAEELRKCKTPGDYALHQHFVMYALLPFIEQQLLDAMQNQGKIPPEPNLDYAYRTLIFLKLLNDKVCDPTEKVIEKSHASAMEKLGITRAQIEKQDEVLPTLAKLTLPERTHIYHEMIKKLKHWLYLE